MKKFLKFMKWFIGLGSVLAVLLAVVVVVFLVRVTKDLPSVEALAEYKPPIMTRVHAGDGKLITEYAKEARVFVPIETIPKDLQHAFVSAEDQRFYTHGGWDAIGLVRATLFGAVDYVRGKRVGGTSTITQQVAKNFLVGDEYSITRKVREIFIARRIEQAMDKDHILELYLNKIYFGRRAYGVAAASLNYFDKPMKDLELAEIAYLALLPKGPNNYRLDNPEKRERALNRRNYVLGRMVEDGYVTQAEADKAKATSLEIVERLVGDEYLAADYFVEEARKQIFSMYGEDELYEGGLSIRTTLDTQMQLKARKALRRGLIRYDLRHGYRGPLSYFENFDDWKKRLAAFEAPRDIGDWRVALVLGATDEQAELGFADLGEEGALPDRGTLTLSDIGWAKKPLKDGATGPELKSVKEAVNKGDIILVQAKPKSKDKTEYNLRQIPEINGGLIAMDPHTGRVLALVGGYSFDQSQFNRVTQAKRQPGSAFKPFVYAAALDEGYTPASQVLDAPFVIERQDTECEVEEELDSEGNPIIKDPLSEAIDEPKPALRGANDPEGLLGEEEEEEEECEKFYKPTNYSSGTWYGLSTLRLGIEKSRNAMTVRLANDIGMRPISNYGRRFGIYDEVRPELAWALGAGETTLLRLSAAYSMLVNGGKWVEPTILDRVQDGSGKTIFVHDKQSCEACQIEEWDGLPPPELPDIRETVIDPVTAYQMTFMLKGVVDNGTGRTIASVGRPLGGKTGTTNDSLDTWFMGFSPDLVAGVYVGFDSPKTLGAKESGSSAAAPIFRDFMKEALAGEDKVPFRIPENVTLSPVNRVTGEPSYIGAPEFILEAFRPGTEPRLGELKSTIRFGGGTDTFAGPNIGGGSDTDFVYDFDDEGGYGDQGSLEEKPDPKAAEVGELEAEDGTKKASANSERDESSQEVDGEDSEDASENSLDKLLNAAEDSLDINTEDDKPALKKPEAQRAVEDAANALAKKVEQGAKDIAQDGAANPDYRIDTQPNKVAPVIERNLPPKPAPAQPSAPPPPPADLEEDIDDGLY